MSIRSLSTSTLTQQTRYAHMSAGNFTISGGNEVKKVGAYNYAVFTSSGTLTIGQSGGDFEVLVVGAGGGGGWDVGGGGGGGAIEGSGFFQLQALAGSYSVTVGAGGAGSNTVDTQGSSGGDSVFAGSSTITAKGGGGGGGGSSSGSFNNGLPGGSGGGGHNYAGVGGAASGSNTFAGGNGYRNAGAGDYGAGGGGGATQAGGNATTSPAAIGSGYGGEGKALADIDANLTSANFTSLSGMTVISSGGSGGVLNTNTNSIDGRDGGTGAGKGGNYYPAGGHTAATDAVSYGSGGGGGGWNSSPGVGTGGDGQDGLVIVRWQ